MLNKSVLVAMRSYTKAFEVFQQRAGCELFIPSLFDSMEAEEDKQSKEVALAVADCLTTGSMEKLSLLPITTNLKSLFENIRLTESSVVTKEWMYPLQQLSIDSLFPSQNIEKSEKDVQLDYQQLWQNFLDGLKKIPQTHRHNKALFLDHLDTLLQHCAHNVPSLTQEDVSLYDHVRTQAAIAVALWRWHYENQQVLNNAEQMLNNPQEVAVKKFLLVQGDFFGIQNFIFANGSQANKQAAKLLRGRSFQVSLFAELAALKVLEACELPSTSQIINAAGKFMILAPNTFKVRERLSQVKEEINQWFLEHSFGLLGLGLAMQEASSEDFLVKDKFFALIKQSFEVLEKAKLQRFNLLTDAPIVFNVDYVAGECGYNQFLPANTVLKGDVRAADISADQIAMGMLLTKVGSVLTKFNRLLVLRTTEKLRQEAETLSLHLPIFGYQIAFSHNESDTGQFAALVKNGDLRRCWDFSLEDDIWQGYARRYINAYIPYLHDEDLENSSKYAGFVDEEDSSILNLPKTFQHIACEDRLEQEEGTFIGKVALATLKGDVDNLGLIFQKGIQEVSFSRMAALSRQMNLFFSLWLPHFCRQKSKNTYTVFAGGDDFFMIGPWLQIQQLAYQMHLSFSRYVAENKEITFSAGIAMTKPGIPVHKLSENAEKALECAKGYQHQYGRKNSVNIYDINVAWKDWSRLRTAFQTIEELKQRYNLSVSYIYTMLSFSELAERAKQHDIEATMWRGLFAYRTKRWVESSKHLSKQEKEKAYSALIESLANDGIEKLGKQYRIPLTNHFYLLRER